MRCCVLQHICNYLTRSMSASCQWELQIATPSESANHICELSANLCGAVCCSTLQLFDPQYVCDSQATSPTQSANGICELSANLCCAACCSTLQLYDPQFVCNSQATRLIESADDICELSLIVRRHKCIRHYLHITRFARELHVRTRSS